MDASVSYWLVFMLCSVIVTGKRCRIPMFCDGKSAWVEVPSNNAEIILKRHFEDEYRGVEASISNIRGAINKLNKQWEEYMARLQTSSTRATTTNSSICSSQSPYGSANNICLTTTQSASNMIGNKVSDSATAISCSATVKGFPSVFSDDVAAVRCPSNCGNSGKVWGTEIYTHDSKICKAAVHAGKIKDREGGIIYVKKLPGQSNYAGSTANGITTISYRNWGASFKFCDNMEC